MKTLDRAWINCLRMWEWISENLPKGFKRFPASRKETEIKLLKMEWLDENRFSNYIQHDCFFCQYDSVHGNSCNSCPAKMIEKNFHCNSHREYSHIRSPQEFYREITRLNSKRGNQNV